MATWLIFWADKAIARVLHRISSTFDIRFCGSSCAGKAYQFFRQAQTGVPYHNVLARPLTQDPLGAAKFRVNWTSISLRGTAFIFFDVCSRHNGLLTPESIHFRENCSQNPQGPLASYLMCTMFCIFSPRFLIG